jgi:hypothetical protein
VAYLLCVVLVEFYYLDKDYVMDLYDDQCLLLPMGAPPLLGCL